MRPYTTLIVYSLKGYPVRGSRKEKENKRTIVAMITTQGLPFKIIRVGSITQKRPAHQGPLAPSKGFAHHDVA